ncbi:DUF1858 domain-containing protein [Paenibacillus sp. J22TS3]|uniref:DUF1858 domain-containing protein n=1 Tax=Paenibacillus sp. J22TS3 TaxID=2807192 RepID=UPI001B294262|nr:DUF1858 domain-containing protein [Paenibacillus sp. J22TS3]GIP24556.1 hypothetical protein J22TS3_48310 [Paenibacillus sp. J22TS3]
MTKQVHFQSSLFDLCTADPEIIDIMVGLGFAQIAKPGMLQTAGRFMTIPKGAAMRKIPLTDIIAAFESQGYEVIV